jgi:hypothetical protein
MLKSRFILQKKSMEQNPGPSGPLEENSVNFDFSLFLLFTKAADRVFVVGLGG